MGRCIPPAGGTWEHIVGVCTDEGHVVSRDYKLCTVACEPNEKDYAGHCDCDKLSIVKDDQSACVLKSECERLRNVGEREICLPDLTCPKDTRLALDNQTCVDYCDAWIYFQQEEEKRCVEECPDYIPIISKEQECTTCSQINQLTPYYVEGYNDCYESCAEVEEYSFHVVGEYLCQHECPEGHHYYEQDHTVCYENCSMTEH